MQYLIHTALSPALTTKFKTGKSCHLPLNGTTQLRKLHKLHKLHNLHKHRVLALCSKFLILHRDEVLRSEQKQLHQSPLSIKPIKTLLKSCQLSLEPCWGDASHGGVHGGLGLLLPNLSSTPTFRQTSTLKVAHNLHPPSLDLSCGSNFQVQNA